MTEEHKDRYYIRLEIKQPVDWNTINVENHLKEFYGNDLLNIETKKIHTKLSPFARDLTWDTPSLQLRPGITVAIETRTPHHVDSIFGKIIHITPHSIMMDTRTDPDDLEPDECQLRNVPFTIIHTITGYKGDDGCG